MSTITIRQEKDTREEIKVVLHFPKSIDSEERDWIIAGLKLIIAHEAQNLFNKVMMDK